MNKFEQVLIHKEKYLKINEDTFYFTNQFHFAQNYAKGVKLSQIREDINKSIDKLFFSFHILPIAREKETEITLEELDNLSKEDYDKLESEHINGFNTNSPDKVDKNDKKVSFDFTNNNSNSPKEKDSRESIPGQHRLSILDEEQEEERRNKSRTLQALKRKSNLI